MAKKKLKHPIRLAFLILSLLIECINVQCTLVKLDPRQSSWEPYCNNLMPWSQDPDPDDLKNISCQPVTTTNTQSPSYIAIEIIPPTSTYTIASGTIASNASLPYYNYGTTTTTS